MSSSKGGERLGEDSQLTPDQERSWRLEFKKLGRDAVREHHQDFRPFAKHDLAVQWLREREKNAELRKRATYWGGAAMLILTLVGVLAAVATRL